MRRCHRRLTAFPVLLAAALIVAAGATSASAQAGLEQVGNLELRASPAYIGGTVEARWTGQPGAPFAILTDRVPGAFTFAGFGTIWMDLGPFFRVVADGFQGQIPPLDPTGSFALSFPVINNPAIDGILFYIQSVGFDSGLSTNVAFSRGASIQFSVFDSYHATIGVMTEPRSFHQTTELDNGALMVVGGGNGSLLSPDAVDTIERYNPYLREFTADTPMHQERTLHRATTLLDGRVLVTGGSADLGTGHATAELYDPATQQWTMIPMTATRIAHTATLLGDGRVLVAGGSNSFVLTPPTSTNFLPIFQSSQNTAEIFDPTTGSFTPTANTMSANRFAHAATTLPDGRILLSGGVRDGQIVFGTGSPLYAATSDIFDPTTNSFSPTGPMQIPRAIHTQDVLTDGTVIAIGGAGGALVVSLPSTEIFDPATGQWTLGPPLPSGQTIGLHTSTVLPDGSIYVAGGAVGAVGAFQGVDVAYKYDIANGFTTLTNLPGARQTHSATWTSAGVVLVGGADAGNPTAMPSVDAMAMDSAIIWTPDSVQVP